MSAAFDTLRLVRTLRDKAHFSSEQAEGMADAMQGDLATKADLSSAQASLTTEIHTLRTEVKTEIQAVRAEVKAEIQAVRTEMKTEIQAVRAELRETELRLEAKKADLIKWVVGMIGFQTVVLLGAALALARALAK